MFDRDCLLLYRDNPLAYITCSREISMVHMNYHKTHNLPSMMKRVRQGQINSVRSHGVRHQHLVQMCKCLLHAIPKLFKRTVFPNMDIKRGGTFVSTSKFTSTARLLAQCRSRDCMPKPPQVGSLLRSVRAQSLPEVYTVQLLKALRAQPRFHFYYALQSASVFRSKIHSALNTPEFFEHITCSNSATNPS